MIGAVTFILFLLIPVLFLLNGTSAKLDSTKPAEYLLWSKNSELNIKEKCPAVDNIIIEAVQIRTDDRGKSFSLHLNSLGPGNNRPFPHLYRFANGKKRGAVWPDFVDASHLGAVLSDLKFAIKSRPVILMAALIWNSFLSKTFVGQDRAFGEDFVFDGIHLVHNQLTTKAADRFIVRLREFAEAENQGDDLIILSENSDSDLHLNRADVNVIDSKIAANFGNPFVVLSTNSDTLNSQIAKSKNYRGILRSQVPKRRRFLSFNRSKTGNSDSDGPSQWEVFFSIVIVGSILIGLVVAFVFTRNYLKRKFREEGENK